MLHYYGIIFSTYNIYKRNKFLVPFFVHSFVCPCLIWPDYCHWEFDSSVIERVDKTSK